MSTSALKEPHHNNRLNAIPEDILSCLKNIGWFDGSQSGLPNFIGRGQEASVWSLPKKDFTIRIPHDLAIYKQPLIDKEVSNQMSFFFGVLGGLAAGKIDDDIRVPIVWNDPSFNSGLPNGIIVMQTVQGRTLFYYAMTAQ